MGNFFRWAVQSLHDARAGYCEAQWQKAGLPLFGEFTFISLQAKPMPSETGAAGEALCQWRWVSLLAVC